MVIQPVNKPQAEPIRVAYDRIRRCSELMTSFGQPELLIVEVNTVRKYHRPLAIQMMTILLMGTKLIILILGSRKHHQLWYCVKKQILGRIVYGQGKPMVKFDLRAGRCNWIIRMDCNRYDFAN